MDIASDLIRSELVEEAHRSSDLTTFDSHSGNKLAFVTFPERTRRKSAYLAFPMGPTGCNLEEYLWQRNSQVTKRVQRVSISK